MSGCGLTGRQAAFCHFSNHLQAAGEGKSGMLMGVHPAGFLEDWVFGDSSLSNPIRMNTGYNLLKLHSCAAIRERHLRGKIRGLETVSGRP